MTLSNKTGGKAPGPRPVIVRDSDTRFGERGRSASGGGAATRMRGIGVTIPRVRGPGMATLRDARSSQTPVRASPGHVFVSKLTIASGFAPR